MQIIFCRSWLQRPEAMKILCMTLSIMKTNKTIELNNTISIQLIFTQLYILIGLVCLV